jgi:hypothetical protein
VTSDNAANMDKLLLLFEGACRDRDVLFDKNEQHVRCVLHVLNLSVQILLRELKAEAPDGDDDYDGTDPDNSAAGQGSQLSCIAKLRSVIIKVRNSPQRRHEFHAQCDASRVPKKELILDTRTRWGSTHAMLQRACELRMPLSRMARLSTDLQELGDDEWGLVKVSFCPVTCPAWCSAADVAATTTVCLSRSLCESLTSSQEPFHCYPPPAATPR